MGDGHSAAMSVGATPAAEIRAWMRQILKDHPEMSPASWAKKAEVAATTIQRAIKDDYPFVTSSRTLAKLAEAVGQAPPQVGSTKERQVVPHFLSVRYRAQAGLWYEVDGDHEIEQVSHPVVPDPRYAEWPQWLELVVGDSANKRIGDGEYAHVVDAIEMGFAPKTGKWVVVERRRAQGAIRERTIKQIEVTPEGEVLLCPRSTNPKWSEPISLTAGTKEGEEIEVEIVGLVIGKYDPEF